MSAIMKVLTVLLTIATNHAGDSFAYRRCNRCISALITICYSHSVKGNHCFDQAMNGFERHRRRHNDDYLHTNRSSISNKISNRISLPNLLKNNATF